MSRGYARGREKDEAIRASLEPLAPGERPKAVTVAAIVAAVLGLSLILQVVLIDDADVDGLLVFAAVMFLAAAGMWKAQYWAVLGFEGAIWRGFGLGEMLLPCGVLVGVGVLAFTLGTRNLARREG